MFRMPKILTILIVNLSIYAISYAQAPDTIWTRTYGGAAKDDCYSITRSNDGNFAIVGYTCSFGLGNSACWLLKMNDNGDTLWSNTYGLEIPVYGRGIIAAHNGGYIITGQTGDFLSPGYDYLIKVNSLGVSQWTQVFGGGFLQGIRYCSDNNYVAIGSIQSHTFLVKIDSCGDSIWTHRYRASDNNFAYDVQECSNPISYLYVGCTISGYVDSSWDAIIIKVDSRGFLINSRRYGYPGGGAHDIITSIEPTYDGTFIVAGTTMTFGVGGLDFWLLRINNWGDTLWTRTYGGPLNDYAVHAIQDINGGFIMVGYTESFGAGGKDVFVVKTDNRGNLLWTKTIGGPSDDNGRKVVAIGKNEYIIVGYTESFGAGDRDAYVIKLGGIGSEINDSSEVLISNNLELFQNFPNPFNSSTQIEYYLPVTKENISIEFYDLLGRRVALLRGIDNGIGYHKVYWQPNDLSTGLYFYKIQAGDYSETKRMMLIK